MNFFIRDSATVLRGYALLLIVAVVPLCLGCSSEEQPTEPEQLSLQFQEELTIGSDTSSSLEVQLATPAEVRTDSDGNIYISDHEFTEIKVFDSEGDFLHSIGQEGNGPGEFGEITALEINDNENLIVMDAQNNRITRFSMDGSVIGSQPVQSDAIIWPRYFRQISTDNHLVLRKPSETPGITDENELLKQSSLLHLYDEEFNYITSFAHIDSVMDASSGFVQYYTTAINAGNFCYLENGDVWYVPGIYNATLYGFSQRNDGWGQANSIKGNLIPNESISLDSDAEGAISISTYTRDGMQSFSSYVKSESVGLFQLTDGRLVHISNQLQGEERITQVEVFSPEGRLVGVGQLDEFTFPGTMSRIPISSFWMDENDRFYLVDNRNIPVVRVGRIAGL